jgi:hypothetical protein
MVPRRVGVHVEIDMTFVNMSVGDTTEQCDQEHIVGAWIESCTVLRFKTE